MKRQRGIVLTAYLAAAAGIVILALSAAVWIQTARLKAEKAAFVAFTAQVKVIGEQAAKEAAKQTAADQRNKERSDAENTTLRATNAALARSLRDTRAGSRFVPAAPASSRRPELAVFDRTELERTLQQLDAGVSGLIAEGDTARIDLDTARRWAQP